MLPSSPSGGFLFRFGLPAKGGGLAVPVLAGDASETLFAGLPAVGEAAGFRLHGDADWLVGLQVAPLADDLDAQTEAVYRDMLALLAERGMHPARIWNYVPDINADSACGLEVYRVFCRGRSHAFERAGWTGPVPAASAVGGAPGTLAVMFAATRAKPVARENPEQMPAFEYPPDYGPRSPSFSRAMQVDVAGRRWTFISGTAAIKGHVSRAVADLGGQIACTLDNLRLISLQCGLGPQLSVETGVERHFKIYLRHAADLPVARALLEGVLLRLGDRVTWLQSDICRAELLVEIEATLVTAPALPKPFVT